MDIQNNDNLLEIRDLCFSYPDMQEQALDHIDLNLKSGSFTVLCGQSGCGKSTLLRQLKSVLKPHGTKSGVIFFGGRDLDDIDMRTQTARIGFVMQDPDTQIVTDKVWHELAFGLESLGYDTPTIRLRVAEMASYFGIQQWFYKKVEELSGGQKQLLNLAAIMAMHPTLLILDEPTSQLDPIAASDFLETIRKINRELGTTILMTEHRLEDVLPMADTAVLMEHGKILYTGTPRDAGLWMYDHEHPMFEAMPSPLQIYAQANGHSDLPPITVREGRSWLNEHIGWKEDFSALLESKSKHVFSASDNHPSGSPIIQLDEVWFRYEKDSPDVVKGLTMKVYPGEIYCLLGGNGTGKSTTMSLISRVRQPYRGKILINGKDIRKYTDSQLYTGFMGVMPQNPQSLFVKKTVELELYEMIGGTRERISEEFPVDMEKKAVVENIASLTHLDYLMDHHPYDLSGGEQQRLALAKILLLRPKLLLMDEPTKGIDAFFKKEFADILQTLKKHGVSIFMISHDIEFCARYADRCGMFFDGGIVTENTPSAFFAGNSFYTTSTNRMARHIWPDAVIPSDVIAHIRAEASHE